MANRTGDIQATYSTEGHDLPDILLPDLFRNALKVKDIRRKDFSIVSLPLANALYRLRTIFDVPAHFERILLLFRLVSHCSQLLLERRGLGISSAGEYLRLSRLGLLLVQRPLRESRVRIVSSVEHLFLQRRRGCGRIPW